MVGQTFSPLVSLESLRHCVRRKMATPSARRRNSVVGFLGQLDTGTEVLPCKNLSIERQSRGAGFALPFLLLCPIEGSLLQSHPGGTPLLSTGQQSASKGQTPQVWGSTSHKVQKSQPQRLYQQRQMPTPTSHSSPPATAPASPVAKSPPPEAASCPRSAVESGRSAKPTVVSKLARAHAVSDHRSGWISTPNATVQGTVLPRNSERHPAARSSGGGSHRPSSQEAAGSAGSMRVDPKGQESAAAAAMLSFYVSNRGWRTKGGRKWGSQMC